MKRIHSNESGKLRLEVSRGLGTPGQGTMRSTSSDAYEQLRKMLVEARRKSGLSQQEVADRLGRPQTYVSKCERGTRRMDVVEVLEIAQVIGFNPIAFIRRLSVRR